MSAALRISLALATKKGADFLTKTAYTRNLVLTYHREPVAVAMNPEHFDELKTSLRDAYRQMQRVTDLVVEKPEFHSVDDVRERLHACRRPRS